jgi:hypothetical protein
MANEFKHKDPCTTLTQAEYIAACGDGHIFACQATGDIVYASSTTVLSKLAKGAAGTVLSMGCSCIPDWTTSAASATVASTVVVVDGTDTSSFVAIFDSATGSLAPKTDAGLAYNAGTGMLTATGLTGPLTGLASSATILATARAIGGVCFDGSAAINLPGVNTAGNQNTSGTAATVTGGTQASITTVANVVTVGALNAGSITSGFGTIDTGSSAVTTTGLITGGTFSTGNSGTAKFLDGDGSHYFTLAAHATTTASVDYTWPAADGSCGQVLSTDSCGVLTWASAGGISGLGSTDNVILRANGTGGATAQGSGVVITDANAVLIGCGTACLPALAFKCDTDTGFFRDANLIKLAVGGALNTTWTGGSMLLGDTGNGNGSQAATLNQAAYDDEILTLKSSDVAHGVTNVTETDTFFKIQKVAAANGGAEIYGLSDGNAYAVRIQAIIGAAGNTTKSTSASGAFDVFARQNNGVTTQSIGANGNLVAFRDDSTTRFIFDAEGSGHADVEWTTYSDNRLKFNQEVVPYGLDTLLQLQPKIYCKDSGDLVCGVPVLEGKRRRQIGFVAQEVMALIPETVKDICSCNSWYSLEDGKLTAVVVKAVQELTARVAALEGR